MLLTSFLAGGDCWDINSLSVIGRLRCFSISRMLGFATLCANQQKLRYRPWITASSLLRLSGDVVNGETVAQMCLCKNGCQVGILTKVMGGQNKRLIKTSHRSINCLIRMMCWLPPAGSCGLLAAMERVIGLQHQREPQHIFVLDAVLHQGLRVVDKEVILDDGIDAKAVALVIGELVAEAAGTEFDAVYPFPGQAGQHEVQQAGADTLLLAVGGNGDIEDFSRLLPHQTDHTGAHYLVAIVACQGGKAPGAGQIGGNALLCGVCLQQQCQRQLVGIHLDKLHLSLFYLAVTVWGAPPSGPQYSRNFSPQRS